MTYKLTVKKPGYGELEFRGITDEQLAWLPTFLNDHCTVNEIVLTMETVDVKPFTENTDDF